MNLQALLRDRRVLWGGAAAAAAAGAFVLWRRRQTTGSTTPSGDTGTPAANAGGSVAGFPDTTGTNIATWLGQYGESLQAQLDEYQREVRDAIAALQTVPTSGGTGTAPVLARRSLPSSSGTSLPNRRTSSNWQPAPTRSGYRTGGTAYYPSTTFTRR